MSDVPDLPLYVEVPEMDTVSLSAGLQKFFWGQLHLVYGLVVADVYAVL